MKRYIIAGVLFLFAIFYGHWWSSTFAIVIAGIFLWKEILQLSQWLNSKVRKNLSPEVDDWLEPLDEESEETVVEENKEGFNGRIFWIGVIITFLFLMVTSAILHNNEVFSEIFGQQWSWGWALALSTAFYVIVSWKVVGPQEKGGRFLLGIYTGLVKPGPVFVPALLCHLELVTRLEIPMELPDEPENIFREEGSVPEGDKRVPPIRIPFGPASNQNNQEFEIEEDDPFNKRMTQEVVPVVTLQIDSFWKFFTTIGSREQLRRQLEDAAVTMLLEEFTKVTPAVVLKNMGQYNEKLKKAVLERVGFGTPRWWGVNIIKAEIKLINFSKSLNKEVQLMAEAGAKKRSQVTLAEGEKQSEELRGQGKGAAEKAVLVGRTWPAQDPGELRQTASG